MKTILLFSLFLLVVPTLQAETRSIPFELNGSWTSAEVPDLVYDESSELFPVFLAGDVSNQLPGRGLVLSFREYLPTDRCRCGGSKVHYDVKYNGLAVEHASLEVFLQSGRVMSLKAVCPTARPESVLGYEGYQVENRLSLEGYRRFLLSPWGIDATQTALGYWMESPTETFLAYSVQDHDWYGSRIIYRASDGIKWQAIATLHYFLDPVPEYVSAETCWGPTRLYTHQPFLETAGDGWLYWTGADPDRADAWLYSYRRQRWYYWRAEWFPQVWDLQTGAPVDWEAGGATPLADR